MVEHQHTANVIIQQENKELKALNNGKKHVLSGKRKIIEGKHILRAKELAGKWIISLLD